MTDRNAVTRLPVKAGHIPSSKLPLAPSAADADQKISSKWNHLWKFVLLYSGLILPVWFSVAVERLVHMLRTYMNIVSESRRDHDAHVDQKVDGITEMVNGKWISVCD